MSPSELTPRKLILGLLLAADGRPVAAAEVVHACDCFDLSESSARVALTRLARDGRIRTAGHGLWELAPEATPLIHEARAWRRSEERIRRWRGDFVLVHTGNLGRSDRTALRRRQRALHLVGFRELERGLHLRPNNLERDLDALRDRLHRLGLEESALVLAASQLGEADRTRVDGLWDTTTLDAHYRTEAARLDAWIAGHHALSPRAAARESWLLGAAAIRSLVYDPWLPDPMVDVAARHHFFQAVCRFDDCGRRIWTELLGAFRHLPVGRPEALAGATP